MSASEPKVMIPYNTEPGEVPRQVQIERKKRLFALQDISTLLDEKKVDLSDKTSPGFCKKLKIETFDNTTYESRNQEEWCPQTTSTGKTEATAVQVGEDGSITWMPCHVMGTKKDDNTYLVRYTETSEEVWLPRMYICFKAEDPSSFRRGSQSRSRRGRHQSSNCGTISSSTTCPRRTSHLRRTSRSTACLFTPSTRRS